MDLAFQLTFCQGFFGRKVESVVNSTMEVKKNG